MKIFGVQFGLFCGFLGPKPRLRTNYRQEIFLRLSLWIPLATLASPDTPSFQVAGALATECQKKLSPLSNLFSASY
jgi:hypothetical protein